MNKNVLEYVVEKTNDLIGASTCSEETRAAAQAWLDAVGTDREAEENRKYSGSPLFAKNLSIFRHKNTGNRQLPISGIFIIFSYIHFIRAPRLYNIQSLRTS